MENKLAKLIGESGLDETKAQVLTKNFSDYFEIAAQWKVKADSIQVTSIKHTTEMKMAREGRLFLKEKRVAVEKMRKQLKENALKEGQAIDKIAKFLTELISPIEEDLEKKEKFAEIQATRIKESIRAMRELELAPYKDFVPVGVDLLNMDEPNYQKLLSNSKLLFDNKAEEDRKAEEVRVQKEKDEAAEKLALKNKVEELEATNAKLLEEKTAPIQTGSVVIPTVDLNAKSDKERLNQLASIIDELNNGAKPALNSDEAKKILSDAKVLLFKTTKFIREKTANL